MIKILNEIKNLNELRKLFRKKATQGEPLSVMDDVVFKIMLTSDTEDSREALRSLLSACTRREVKEVKVLNNELFPSYIGGKRPRLDVKITFNDGEIANLEMQIDDKKDDLKRRSSQYAAMLQAGQAKKGMLYKGIKRVYQIFFVNKDLFPQSDKFPRRYGYREEKEHDLLTDTTEIIFYELPKLEQRVKDYFADKSGSETLSSEEKWCIFLRYRHDKNAKQLISELCDKEDGIMRAEKQVNKISRSLLKYMREMDDIKDEWDRQDREEEYKEKIREEREKEIAGNLLAKGSTFEFIQEITGLDMDTIKGLSN
ncbi:MAG: Rpn family recombination-promoting nuclease/putative transposase [Treponema sp.]|nr:Rpn family recombination-promoting nuclease/putative transposase [Treponema sp.]